MVSSLMLNAQHQNLMASQLIGLAADSWFKVFAFFVDPGGGG